MDEISKIEKLQSVSQWLVWKFQVKIILSANDLFGVVSGKTAKPSETNEKYAAWCKTDMKAQKVIATTVGQQPLLHIINCTHASEMWTKLHSVYEQKSDSSIHLLQQRFYAFTKDPSDSMASHISKLEELVQQIKDLGEPISQTMIMTKILMTLPSSYDHFHSAWESTEKDKRTMENLRSRLMIEESRMMAKEPANSGEALLAKRGKF